METTVIIPAAASCEVDKDLPISMVKIGRTTLLQRQMKAINRLLKQDYKIVVLGGHQWERQKKYPNLDFIKIDNWKENNICCSIQKVLDLYDSRNFMILYGDLFMEGRIFTKEMDNSCLVVDNGYFSKDSVGLVINNHKVTNVYYGLDPKWSQIAFFTKDELKLLRETFCSCENSNKMFLFEIINKIIDAGGKFKPYYSRGRCKDIDTSAELKKIIREKICKP